MTVSRWRGRGGGLVTVLLALATLAAPSAGARADSGIDPRLAAGWQATENDWRQHRPLPGVTAAVQLADGSTWQGVSGDAQLGPGAVAVTPDTPFLIASVTKTFVASTVLELVQEGTLSLDDHLSRFLPHFPRARLITLRMLLGHTSGIADIFNSPDFKRLVLKRPDHVWTFDEILSMVGAPYFAPGTSWGYSNTNYILLGRIIELATGKPVSEEIRNRFLDPLGLSDTWFQGEETQGSRTTAAIGYARRKGQWVPWAPHDALRPSTSEATFVWSAGAMVSTARDLATWARALYGGHVLSPQSLAEMIDFGPQGYGLGARRTELGGRKAWGHGGSLEGFETSMWYLPTVDASIVVMWNRAPLESDGLADRFATRLVNAIDRDVTPPVVGSPTFAIEGGAAVRSGRVPVIVAWKGHDSQGHIARYQARVRTGKGRWRMLRLASDHATSVALRLRPGARTRVAVRATDGDGNQGPWVSSQTVLASSIDSASSAVILDGAWQTRSIPAAIGGSVERSRTRGSSATLDVEGIAVGIVASEGPASGRVAIRLDGGTGSGVDLRVPTQAGRRVVFAQLLSAPGPHQLVLRVKGGQTPGRVDLDAFFVLQAVSRPH